MRWHLSCDIIHLLPEKSLSLTSRDDTRARCSIQTTCFSFWKKQQISPLILRHAKFTFSCIWRWQLSWPRFFFLLTADEVKMWMKDGLHHCTLLCWSVCWIPGAGRTSTWGWRKQIPSLPLAALILELGLSFEGMEEWGDHLDEEHLPISFIVHQVNAHSLETFSRNAG